MRNRISQIEEDLSMLQNKIHKSNDDNDKRSSLIKKLGKELNKEESNLLQDLSSIGLSVSSVWDLISTKEKYSNAIPILISHLTKEYHAKNKEGIVRALAVEEAIGKANSILIEEYYKASKDKESLRWAIGNTIYTIVTEEDVESIFRIIQNKENGISRQMFVASLGKIKSEAVENVLIDLLSDDEVVLHALTALAKIKSKKAIDEITMLTSNSNTLIRKEAQKALKRINKV